MVEALVIKIFYFVVAIFSVTLVFLFSSDPYFAEQFKQDLRVSNMQANEVIDYEVNATNVIAIYEADEINRYSNKDEALKFRSTSLRSDQTHFLSSDKAILEKNLIKFQKNAKYENNESMKFLSQEIIYDTKSKILSSEVPFEMFHGVDRAIGKSVVYNTQNKQMQAKEIKAWVKHQK
ncbi:MULTISPECIES: LPS export ABC transporter periplasmic protein LptC [unclassified Campylobacter]|uniref:LPS export ABC transporter periplasmic protein LptC n=1 Tax=unclassified Campylobacter TaxID=2593542 RepID=UPI003D3544C7